MRVKRGRVMFLHTLFTVVTHMMVSVYGASFGRKQSPSGATSGCDGLADAELRQLLGPAFNPRYMSIDQPPTMPAAGGAVRHPDANGGLKRTVVDYAPDFYVDNQYSDIVDERPAWDVTYSVARRKRGSTSRKQTSDKPASESGFTTALKPWECNVGVRWIDLGREYFPRYLRGVECISHDCWYGHYTCKPRSFTVKILRRRSGLCAPHQNSVMYKTGQEGLPKELRHLWVWEERAVNFCCECST